MSQSSISLRRVLAAAASVIALLAAAPVPAQTALEPVAAPQPEALVVAHLETLSDERLKAFYLRCSDAAVGGQLGSGEIALCSIGYEMLLKRSFGGDFMALLAWSRQHDSARLVVND
jgi:hypothetical protein